MSEPAKAGFADPAKAGSADSAKTASADPAKAGSPEPGGAGAGEPFKVGLLGAGTVGAAFAELLEERAGHIERLTGRRPVLSGVLSRTRGDFEEILGGAELVVELMGGVEPAREYVLRAMAAGRHVVTANKQLLSQHGEELFAAAGERGVQLRFEAAVAGVIPVIRVLGESLAGAHVERIHGIVNGTTNFILTEMAGGASYEEALAEAQRAGYAEADPSDDVSGRDAAAKMAILARLAFGTPVSLGEVRYEGIEHLHGDDLQYARELGLGLKLIGTAERLDGGLSVRVHPAFLYAGHPLASVGGPFNAVTVESEAITEITMSGPGAGGRQTASAVLGDVVSVMLHPAPIPRRGPAGEPLKLVEDVESSFYIHLEVADRAGVLSAISQVLGERGASIKSVVQRGMGESARLVMVTHPLAESRMREALGRLGELDFVRAPPRAIRVIEEEFV
ncbi:MAG TPA: homoserine dehydrogenase [Solirubrobacteraceae bacterium]|jgi:homoserine dehydrogenase|nr:homoserine dehydrogenase [Solirubrobacteraceae bacterium]